MDKEAFSPIIDFVYVVLYTLLPMFRAVKDVLCGHRIVEGTACAREQEGSCNQQLLVELEYLSYRNPTNKLQWDLKKKSKEEKKYVSGTFDC